MRMIFVLFDSLNRRMLQPYGGDIETPNFQRLADRTATFDRHHVGSLPCIPARRDMMTGRASFFHRSWGPMEPWEQSHCHFLREAGVHSHLVTDHYHYFREGGSHFHTRFESWDLIRGQESDNWKAIVDKPLDRWAETYDPRHYGGPRSRMRQRHQSYREFVKGEEDHTTPRCFASAFEFLDTNRAADDWMLQLELFDPHEPFFVPDRFRRSEDSDWDGRILDWPYYTRDIYTEAEAREIRANYRALVRMCDEYLGRLLDYMDDHAMWEDTALMVGTDHGFLLGEHEWWGKGVMPYYDELVHTPLFLHVPGRTGAGTRCGALTQTPDAMPTILDIFGLEPPPEVTARSLLGSLDTPDPDRVVAFGYFAGPVGVTDGRHVLMHYAPQAGTEGLHQYTLMPQHLNEPFSVDELKTARMSPPFDFTRGVPVMQIDVPPGGPKNPGANWQDAGFRLYDLDTDPDQQAPIRNAGVESRLYEGLRAYMQRHDAPSEYYDWLGLAPARDSRTA